MKLILSREHRSSPFILQDFETLGRVLVHSFTTFDEVVEELATLFEEECESTRLREELSEAEGDLDAAENKVDDLESDIQKLEEELDDLKSNLSTADARIAELEEQFTTASLCTTSPLPQSSVTPIAIAPTSTSTRSSAVSSDTELSNPSS